MTVFRFEKYSVYSDLASKPEFEEYALKMFEKFEAKRVNVNEFIIEADDQVIDEITRRLRNFGKWKVLKK